MLKKASHPRINIVYESTYIRYLKGSNSQRWGGKKGWPPRPAEREMGRSGLTGTEFPFYKMKRV